MNKIYTCKSILLSFFVFFSIIHVKGKDIKENFDSIANEVEVNAFSYGKNARKSINQLKEIAIKHPDNIELITRALYLEASVNYYQGINDSTFLMKCLLFSNTCNNEQYPLENAVLNYTLSLIYSLEGNYANAFSMALRAAEYFQSVGENPYISKVYYLLGNICAGTKSTKMAINYYNQALCLAEPGTKDYYLPFIALQSNLFSEEEKRGEVIGSLEKLVSEVEAVSDPGIVMTIYFNLGSIYYRIGDQEKGAHYYGASLKQMNDYEIDNQSLSFGLAYNTANIHMGVKDYSQALHYGYLAKEAASKSKNLNELSYALFLISDIYEHLDNVDSAYHYLTQHTNVKTRLFNNSKTIESYQAYISIFLDSLQKELKIADQNKRQFTIIIISVSVVLILNMLLLLVLYQKRRTMAKQMEQDRQINELQKEMIESQKRELSAHALLLSEKNKILQKIDSHVQYLPASNDDVKAIKQIVKSNLTTEQAWENFMVHFNKVHPDFFEKLKARTPVLTENNLRLCAYLRISMPAKDIAQILNMSYENVRKSSYRLKKKLDLNERDNLYDFLRSI